MATRARLIALMGCLLAMAGVVHGAGFPPEGQPASEVGSPWTGCAAIHGPREAAVEEDPDTALALAECLMGKGKNGQALLLLQRLVSSQPSNAAAVEMLSRAGRSLGLAQGGAVTPRRSSRGRWSGWLAVAAGRDSNVNGLADHLRIPGHDSLDLGGNLNRLLDDAVDEELQPYLTRKESPFVGGSAGLLGVYSIAPTWELALSGAASVRLNSEAILYIPLQAQVSGALVKSFGPLTLNTGLKSMHRWLAIYPELSQQNWTLGAGLHVTRSIVLEAALDAGRNRYSLLEGLGAGLRTRTQGWRAGVRIEGVGLSLQIGAGTERGEGDIRDLDRNFNELSLTLSHGFDRMGRLTVGWATGKSDFTEYSSLLQGYRRDQTQSLFATLDYPLSANWHLMPRLTWDSNESNFSLATFSREQWMIELRRDF